MPLRPIINFVMAVLPATKMFRFKRYLLNFLGIYIGLNSKITGGLKIYGRSDVRVGDNVWLGINVRMYLSPDAGVYIGNNCDIAPEVVFHSGSHLIGNEMRRAGAGLGKAIRIGDGVWVGTGVKILAGCDVGSGSIVAAGALLLDRKYPGNCILAGVPAKVVKELK